MNLVWPYRITVQGALDMTADVPAYLGLLRWGAAWGFYWAGDVVSRVDRLLPEKSEVTCYPFYNWLMQQSSDCQGADPRGPWVDVPESHP